MKNITKNKKNEELKLRVFWGVILAGLSLFFVWFSVFLFQLLCLCALIAMLFEWVKMTKIRKTSLRVSLFLFVILPFFAILAGFGPDLMISVMVLGVFICLVESGMSREGLWASAGILYTGFGSLSLLCLRGKDLEGLKTILFLLIVVWCTDICAYSIGRMLGGPKLFVKISPNKTYSGAIGGILGGTAAACLCIWLFQKPDTILWIYKGALLSVAVLLGDLLESCIKRYHKVKDSGNLIPGHGGVLDRIDGLVVAAVVFYFWLL